MRRSTWIGAGLALVAVAGMIANAAGSRAAQQIPPTTGRTAASSPIDMRTDTDADRLPDALVHELYLLAAEFERDLDGSAAREVQPALAALVGRLPVAQNTRASQEQVADLLAKQRAASDPAEKRALAQQIDALLQQAENDDPLYQLALATIAHLAGRESAAQPAQTPGAQAGPDFSQLQRGDILLVRGGNIYLNWIYAQHYSHAGIYDGDGMVYESNPDGLRLKPLADWQKPGHLVALGRIDSLPVDKVLAALDHAKRTYKTNGTTHYNHDIPDKWIEDKLYCSQLVWNISEHAGVDLDSNDFWYLVWIATRLGPAGPEFAIPAVLPDELALSDHLTIYSAGITQ